ncbi:hypothetical protein EW146_g9602, partial [Bondarzewia mesenterica]
KHGIVTESYGGQSPVFRSKGGPVDPVLVSIAERLSKTTGKTVQEGHVLMLWQRYNGIVFVTTTSKEARLKEYLDAAALPDLTREEVAAIDKAGSELHKRHFANVFPDDIRWSQVRIILVPIGFISIVVRYGISTAVLLSASRLNLFPVFPALSNFLSSFSGYAAYGEVSPLILKTDAFEPSSSAFGTLSDSSFIYVLLAIYGASTSTTTLACLSVLLNTPTTSAETIAANIISVSFPQRMILLSSYLPFFFLPLYMTVDMAFRIEKLVAAGLRAGADAASAENCDILWSTRFFRSSQPPTRVLFGTSLPFFKTSFKNNMYLISPSPDFFFSCQSPHRPSSQSSTSNPANTTLPTLSFTSQTPRPTTIVLALACGLLVSGLFLTAVFFLVCRQSDRIDEEDPFDNSYERRANPWYPNKQQLPKGPMSLSQDSTFNSNNSIATIPKAFVLGERYPSFPLRPGIA